MATTWPSELSVLAVSLSTVEDDLERAEKRVLAFLSGCVRALAPFFIAVFTDEVLLEIDDNERVMDLDDMVMRGMKRAFGGKLNTHHSRLGFYILRPELPACILFDKFKLMSRFRA